MGGLQKSDLLIIAGRPGMGKTGFMLSVMKNAALKHKKHVAMFSLEMSNEQLVQRLIAQETGIDTQRLRTGKLTEEEIPLFTHAIEVLSDTHIFLDDTPAITPLQLRTKCRRLHLEYELDLVIVDYLQLMSADMRNDNRVQEVSYISRNLKVLARELNVPVLAGAQLSRAVEQRADKRPVLSDLRESGVLEQDADIVMFIHRPDALEKDSPKAEHRRNHCGQAPQRSHPPGHRAGLPEQPGALRKRRAAAGAPVGEGRSMPSFAGFPSGKVRLTPIPGPFFSELLPEIDHLGELKVTLYAFWFLDHLEAPVRYLTYADFAG